MEWFNQSFEQNSILWLILSGLIGGSIPVLLKLISEQFITYNLKRSRELRKVIQHYSSPLLRTGQSLERRVNNFIRSGDEDWILDSEYYKLSTLYVFGEFLAWVRILERKTNFLEFRSTKKTRMFERYLYGSFRALTSFAYFRKIPDKTRIGNSAIERMYLTAIGEVMIQEGDKENPVLDFTSFVDGYYNNPNGFRWFRELENFLVQTQKDSLRWDRLILLQCNLKRFLWFMDEKKRMISDKRRVFVNMDSFKNESVKEELLKELKREFGRDIN